VGSVWGWMEGALRAGRPFPRGTAPADLGELQRQEAADAADAAAVRRRRLPLPLPLPLLPRGLQRGRMVGAWPSSPEMRACHACRACAR
jgi:hypothetical protein